MSELVSLIMPVWHPRADWLHEAVASALEERACEVELIVIDDGCEPTVASLLTDFDDPRLRVVRIDHAGPYAARNVGIKAARGSFLRFIDADDMVVAGSTARLLAAAMEEEGVVAYGGTLMCDESLAPQRVFTSTLRGNAEEACVLGRFEVFLVSLLFPRAVVDRAGAWETEFPVSGDWDFVLRALEQARVRGLGEVVTHYRRHERSISRAADVAMGAKAGQMVLDRYFERHPERRGSRLERAAYLRLHLDRGRAHTWRGERRLAAGQLARAARRDPAAVTGLVARRTREGGLRVLSRLRTRMTRAREIRAQRRG